MFSNDDTLDEPKMNYHPDRRKRQSRYSPIITLGNILTIISLVAGGVGMWVSVNSRLTTVENLQASGKENALRRDAEVQAMRHDWEESIRDMRADNARLGDKLDRIYELVTQRSKP